jgi:hypothetical protein
MLVPIVHRASHMQRWLIGVALVATTACAEDAPPLRYRGAIQVTETASNTSVFGRITIPEELAPTASTGGCDYFATRQRAGVTLGSLTLEGLNARAVIEPTSFIDGMLYLGTLDADAFADGAQVTGTLDEARGPVAIVALAPSTLTSVILPAQLSRSNPTVITWQAGDGDDVEVALSSIGLGTSQELRCTTPDTGSFTFPTAALDLLDTEGDDVTLSVTRRTRGHTASELADAEIDLVP